LERERRERVRARASKRRRRERERERERRRKQGRRNPFRVLSRLLRKVRRGKGALKNKH